MLKKAALLFGVVLVVVGLLGFVSALTPDGKLLGLFTVNTVHNIVHLATGIVALLVYRNEAYARMYFQVFGVVYAIVTVVGFVTGSVLGLFDVNGWDNVLHLVIAAASLYLGFMPRGTVDATPAV